jgi:hypothetical protein
MRAPPRFGTFGGAHVFVRWNLPANRESMLWRTGIPEPYRAGVVIWFAHGVEQVMSPTSPMSRRTFASGTLGLAAALALSRGFAAAQATPGSEAAAKLPSLEITLTDTGFEFPQPLAAGRYAVTVTNAGTSTESHFALGRIPDEITDAQYATFLESPDESSDLTFEAIEFVGVPDWPQPGRDVSGVIDLAPGRYFMFDPFTARGYITVIVDGVAPQAAEPASDLTVELKDMTISLPEAAFTSERTRWKIVNTGAMSHDVAVVPVSTDFTGEHLQMMFTLPEGATPPPGTPELAYQPVAAIGILAPAHTSWLDVQLAPGRYLAICALPFSTGYPHAMDGMYLFFDVP